MNDRCVWLCPIHLEPCILSRYHKDSACLCKDILERHRGAANAIRVRTLAELLGTTERNVQYLMRELAETVLIGSTCNAKKPGYFLPETQDEVDATIAQYRSRIRELFALIRATMGAAGLESMMEQLRLEMEES